MKNQFKLICVLSAAMLGGLCFAPIEDMPDGAKFHGELSQSQLDGIQGGGSVVPTVEQNPTLAEGSAPRLGAGDNQASSVISGAVADAEASLKQSETDEKTPPRKAGWNMLLAGVLILVGLASAFGVRSYMDRAIPDPFGSKK